MTINRGLYQAIERMKVGNEIRHNIIKWNTRGIENVGALKKLKKAYTNKEEIVECNEVSEEKSSVRE